MTIELAVPAFLAGGGEMGERIRAYDWSATPLGPPGQWPQSLKTAIRLLLSSGHAMFVWWGPALTQFYNDAYLPSLEGDRHPAALGQPGRECWPEIWDKIGPQIEHVMGAQGATWNDNRLLPIRRHGRIDDAWWSYSFNPIDDSDAPSGVGGVLVITQETTGDMLGRIRRDKEVRITEARMLAVNADLESRVAVRARERSRTWQVTPDLLGVLDANFRFEAVNPAWHAVLGLREQEVVGASIFDLVHPADAARTRADFAGLQHGEPVLRLENRCRNHDDTYRWISWVAVPEGALVYASGRDITAEHAAAEALERSQSQLRQSQKMEAVGQLTGGIAHDFNNLLTGITGSLELMQNRIAAGRLAEVDRYIGIAQTAVTRAAALTHRLLAFSRQQTLDPRAVDANHLVAGMEELIRRTVGPQVTVEVMGADDLWMTLADPNQLENALLNLAINARDAMPAGGRLTIATANRRLDATEAAMRDVPAGEYVTVSVSDTGIGMDADVVARAFDPFFTTKPIGEGTGLGLSMIYGFARQSGGKVRIDSEPGHGTTVSITLPRHTGVREHAKQRPDVAAARQASAGETVLIVDDELAVRLLVVETLEEQGFRVIAAADGAEALRVLRSAARVDLLITDVGLPGGIDGRQVADAGRAERPDLRILFITGYAGTAALRHGRLDAGMQVLTKPFTLETLARRVWEFDAMAVDHAEP